MSKLKRTMLLKNISSVKLAELANLPRPLISYIMNDKALPLREDVLKIAKILKTKPNKIWSKQDYFIKELESEFEPKTTRGDKLHKQVSFRVVTDCYNALMTKTNLNKLGYRSMQEWGVAQLQKFQEQLEELSDVQKTNN